MMIPDYSILLSAHIKMLHKLDPHFFLQILGKNWFSLTPNRPMVSLPIDKAIWGKGAFWSFYPLAVYERYRVIFFTGTPLKVPSTEKLI